MVKETIYSNDTSNNKRLAIKKLFIIQKGVREKFQQTIAKIHKDKLIFIDESGIEMYWLWMEYKRHFLLWKKTCWHKKKNNYNYRIIKLLHLLYLKEIVIRIFLKAILNRFWLKISEVSLPLCVKLHNHFWTVVVTILLHLYRHHQTFNFLT